MVHCCISGCNNNSTDNADISFHAFSRDDAIRSIWLERIGDPLLVRKKYTALKNYRVCSAHFSLDQFRTADRKSLNLGACPTIFMPVENNQMSTMKKSCAALTCFNNSVENPTLTFIPFPSNFELAKRWAIQAGRDDLTKSFTACRKNYLCSEHFESFYFERDSKNTQFKSGFEPVPTIFQSGSLTNLSTNISFAVDENKPNQNQGRQETCDFQIDANTVNLQTVNLCVNDEFGEYNYSGDFLEEFGVNNCIRNADMDDVCRLCAEKFPTTDLTSLFDTKVGNKYLNMLLMWLPVKVNRHDGLPQYICGECGMKLEECSTILLKFVAAYNKLREMCNTEQSQNQHYSMPTITVSKQTDYRSNENMSIDTVLSSETDIHNVPKSTADYARNVINNEHIPELTHFETEQLIESPTNTANKIENTKATTANISNLATETRNTNKIAVKQQSHASNNKSKRVYILRTKPAKTIAAKQITRKEEAGGEDQIMYKCSECSKLLPTQDELFAHCLSVHAVALQGTITYTTVRVTKEMRDNVIDLTTEHLPSTTNKKDDAIVPNNTSSLNGVHARRTTVIDNDPLMLEQVPVEAYSVLEQPVTTGNTINNAPVMVVPEQNVDLPAVDTGLTANIQKNFLTRFKPLPTVKNHSKILLNSKQQIDTNVKENSPEVSETPTVTTSINPKNHSKNLLNSKQQIDTNVKENSSEVSETPTPTATTSIKPIKNHLKNLLNSKQQIDTNVKENSPEVSETPTATTSIKPIAVSKSVEIPNRSIVLKYECSICLKLLTTKKELINHCLTVHSLTKHDSIVCKVIKTRDKQQYSKKPSNIANIVSSKVSEKENISNKQTCQLNNSSTHNISTVASKWNDTVSYPAKKPAMQCRYECPHCNKWLDGRIQLIYHCIVFHKMHISSKIICKVEKSLHLHVGKTMQATATHVQGMIVQDKQPDIELPAPDFTLIENYAQANIDLPESQNTENSSFDLSKRKHRLMFECARCEKRFNTKPELVHHCYVNNCFIGKHKIMCKEVKFRVPLGEQVQKYECLRCKTVFEKKENLIKHSAWYHPSADRPAYRAVYRSEQRRRSVMLVNKQLDNADTYRKQVNRRHTWYKCNYCEEKFTRIYGFNEHLKTCLKRNISVDPNTELPDVPMIKFQLMHKPRRVHDSRLCMYCGKVFCNLTRLQIHERIHTNEQPYKCTECSKKFRSASGLVSHRFTHTNERNYVCHLCGKCYRTQATLRQHVLTHTRQPEQLFVCEICNARYTSRHGLRKHKAKHTELVVSHKCTMCDKSFMGSEKLEHHVQIKHVNKYRFQCPDCPKKYARKCRLTMHRNTHTGEKPYLCEICGKAFSSYGTRYRHRLIHFGEKRYMCDVCGKRFLRATNLNAHRKIHTDAKPFECDICGKTFAHRKSVAHHKRIHQQVTAEPQRNEPQVVVEQVDSCDPSHLLILSDY